MPLRDRLTSILAILSAAAVSMWPAWLNHYPLLYPDSLGYLGDGRSVVQQFVHRTGDFAGMRSEFYALGILPWHRGISPWPVIVLHALLTAGVVYMVIRAFLPQRTMVRFLILTTALSALTTMSWYVSLVMPDILGPLLYLSLCLLVFAGNSLSTPERIGLIMLSWWCLVSHATHLLVTGWILLLLAGLWLFRNRFVPISSRALAEVGGIFACAIISLLALHGYLYKRPSLAGNRVPYLSARFLADGPERLYLETHCGAEHWVLCANIGHFPGNDDEFIWGDDTIWTRSSTADKQRILQEETPLAIATLRAYPIRQSEISLRSFFQQMNDFGVNDFDNNTWAEESIEETMPGAHASYERSLQAKDRVPSELFTQIQRWPVYLSLIVILGLGSWLWRKRELALVGVSIVVLSTVAVNAFVTAVLSEVDSRYQARVIWLLPLLAGILFFRWRDSREEA